MRATEQEAPHKAFVNGGHRDIFAQPNFYAKLVEETFTALANGQPLLIEKAKGYIQSASN
jgi:hypothetical protein